MAKYATFTGTNVTNEVYTVYVGRCVYNGFRLGMDGTNDVTLTIKDGTKEILPTNTYDASVLGLNGEVLSNGAELTCETGVAATITTTGTFEIVIAYNPITLS